MRAPALLFYGPRLTPPSLLPLMRSFGVSEASAFISPILLRSSSLAGLGLAGSISSAIGSLPLLTSLDMSGNPALSGAVPPQIGSLTLLTSLCAREATAHTPTPPASPARAPARALRAPASLLQLTLFHFHSRAGPSPRVTYRGSSLRRCRTWSPSLHWTSPPTPYLGLSPTLGACSRC